MTVPTLRTAADFVAALPLLIGFHPTESVILAVIDENGCIDPTIRADLEPVGEFGPAAAAVLALLPTTHRHTAALAVVSAQPRSDALDDLARTATAAGMRVAVSVYATATTPGAHWTCCCECGEFGRVLERNTHLQAQAG